MATPQLAYEKVLVDALRLSTNDQLRLLEQLAGQLRQQALAPTRPRRSILELKGVGKKIWNDVDAQQYVDQERESWNG